MILDKLYYLFYKSINRGFGQAERASFLLSLFLFFLFGSVQMIFTVIFQIAINNFLIYSIIFCLVGIAIFVFMSSYYVKSGRYINIKDRYKSSNKVGKSNRTWNLLLILLLIFFSLVTFTLSGIVLSEYLH